MQTPTLWPPSFKAAIFDFDGTLSATASLWEEVDRAFLGARGLSFDSEYARILSSLGFAKGAQYTKERFGLSESVDEICDEWTRMGRALYKTQAQLRPGALNYINALKEKGIRLALATVNDEQVVYAMQHVDVKALFDHCVFADDVKRSKEHPDIYLEAARRLDTEPSDCMVFEDIAVGIRSAVSVGMQTCGLRADDPIQNVEEVRLAADLFLDEWTSLELD